MISIDECISDAMKRLSPEVFDVDGHIQTNTVLTPRECEIYVWPQVWEDSSCGLNIQHSCSMHAITKTLTIVVIGPMMDACVYYDGDLAFSINEVSSHFWDCVRRQDMPKATNTAMMKKFEEKSAKV